MTDSETHQAILIAISRIPKKKHREAALAWLKARDQAYRELERLN
jgi:hypothetical protein